MRTQRTRGSIARFRPFAGCDIRAALAAGLLLTGITSTPAKAAELVTNDDFSLSINMRLQPRFVLDRVAAPGGTKEWLRDFMVRRTRIVAQGKMHDARFKLEWKFDGADQFNVSPVAQVECAYIQYPLGAGIELRAGLYDQPFSRDRLTSDSKQLDVDRGAVSNVPDALGLADNAVGFHLLGKTAGGHAEYALGLFDNRRIPTQFEDIPMVVGRLDLNFGSSKNVFMDTHFGDDSWVSLGVDGSYQGSLEDSSGAEKGSNATVGVDGMIDVPVGDTRLFLRAEGNVIRATRPAGGNAIETRVWMVGAGFLLLERIQPMVRFDQVRLDPAAGGGTTNTTYVGANFYQNAHSVKLQVDVRLEGGTHESVDGVRLQTQLDF